MSVDVEEIGAEVEKHAHIVQSLTHEMEQVIVGQRYMIERLLIGLLANGHVLLEGVPGLAKTLSVTTLAQTLQAEYQRIQFTPDLLPADLIGTLIYQPQTGSFQVRKGPVFANLVLADEINRAPAKVQSALAGSHAGRPGDHRRRHLSPCRNPFSCLPPRIRWSRRAPTPCRKPRSIASC